MFSVMMSHMQANVNHSAGNSNSSTGGGGQAKQGGGQAEHGGGQAQGGQAETKGGQAKSVAAAAPSGTMSHRDKVKDSVNESTKSLFNLSHAKQQAIAEYASSSNLTFDLNESAIELNETKGNLNVSTSNNLSFISKLMPASTTATTTSIADLLQSGIKATAAQQAHKIKDVNEFLLLLTEQAKATATLDPHSPASDNLLYTMKLMKLLLDYGLQATLLYHFELMTKVQQRECTLNSDQPMIMLDIMSRYKRLQHSNVLHSTSLYSSNTGQSGKTKTAARTTSAAPFTGTPCPFHSKDGRTAKHTEENCNEKKRSTK